MTHTPKPVMNPDTRTHDGPEVEITGTGEAMAALLAAGIGSFAIGLVVLLNAAGVWSAPTLYGPAGGVSGRVAIGVVVWLIAWVALHTAWKDRRAPAPGVVYSLTILLIALGIIATFPPLWELFG
jgi:hypothetical protein